MKIYHILVNHEYEVKDILLKLKLPGHFFDLAKKFSKCPSAKSGGDLGEFKKGRFVEAFEEVCEILKPMVRLCRSLFLLPIKWTHSEDQYDLELNDTCHFSLSLGWTLYSLLNFISFGMDLIFIENKFNDVMELLLIINYFTYVFLSCILVCYGIFRANQFTTTLNEISKLMQKDLLCESSKNRLKSNIKLGKLIVNCHFAVQFLAYAFVIFFHFFTTIDLEKYYNIFNHTLSGTSHEVFFLFNYLICIVSLIYENLFTCFESILIRRMSEFSNKPSKF